MKYENTHIASGNRRDGGFAWIFVVDIYGGRYGEYPFSPHTEIRR
jgi:hypothetical protein